MFFLPITFMAITFSNQIFLLGTVFRNLTLRLTGLAAGREPLRDADSSDSRQESRQVGVQPGVRQLSSIFYATNYVR